MSQLPPPLRRGDLIAIVSPASKIDAQFIDAAALQLEAKGFGVKIMPHARGEWGSFSATAQLRLSDMRQAIEDEEIKAILCSRGGYGAVHLLEELDSLPDALFNKWLVGFSDISALHLLWQRKGYASLHAAMAKYLGRGSGEFPYFNDEIDILCGKSFAACYDRRQWLGHTLPPNHPEEVKGRIIGGNLAVIADLIATPYFQMNQGDILFIEDIAEPIYKIERILYQLHLSGILVRASALLLGQFTDYHPSADHPDVETMVERFLGRHTCYASLPVAYGLPVGHIEENRPLLLGYPLNVKITASECVIEP